MRIRWSNPRRRTSLFPWLLSVILCGGCQMDAGALNVNALQAEHRGSAEGVKPGERQTETQRLNQWLDERHQEQLRFSPMMLSFLGSRELYDQIDDMSEAAEARKLAWHRRSVGDLRESFDYDRLSPEGKTSYDVWVYQYEQAAAAAPYRRHDYVFNQVTGFHWRLPTFLMNYHRVDTVEDMQAYIARIGGIARAIGQLQERAELAAEEGIRQPRFAYESAIAQSTAVINGAPFTDAEADAPLWADAKAKAEALVKSGEIDGERAEKLKAAARRALETRFLPAYQSLIAWLKQDMQQTPQRPRGVGSLPGGPGYYRQQLAKMTTTDLTADEIHQIGLQEVARIRDEMKAIKKQVGFEGSLQEFFTFVREDEQFYYPDTDRGRRAYLEDSRAFLSEINRKLPLYFGLLPKAELVVKRVESFREQDGGPQHYAPGAPDGSRPGTYYVHLSDMSAYPTTDMETVAYHEGNPGHHMQLSIAQELEDIPAFRTQAQFTVYSEGWGLYAEKLAAEMGAFKDPYSQFGYLTSEMWRAIRLVVDTGLHARGWSEERAVQYFLDNSTLPEVTARSEVRRYLVWPGQATAYKIGMLKLLELRTRAGEQLGDKFDIRGFHDAVLGGGGLPLPALEARVERWIQRVKRA